MKHRLRRLFQRPSLDRQIDKELQFHLEQQTADYLAAGLTLEEAARRARLDFGGVQQITEDVRDVRAWRWLDDAGRDVQFAARTFRRMPAFALMSVLTLALGIGVNTALFTVVRQVLLKTLPVANPQELVQIDCSSGPGTAGGGICLHSYPAFQLLSERHDGLSSVFAFAPVPNGLIAAFEGSRGVVTGQFASSNAFDVLGIVPAAGRLFAESDDGAGADPVALLSYAYWQKAFGSDRRAVGESIALNNRAVTIVGILPRAFRGMTFGEPYDVVLPLGTAEIFRATGILSNRNMGWLTFLGRRRGETAAEEIGRQLEPVYRQAAEAMIAPVPLEIRRQLNLSAEGLRVNLQPAAHGASSNVRRTLEPTIRVLTVVVSLVLLVACANLGGLFLTQALNRRREFGLRLALGAGRGRLMRQVFTESLLVAVLGGALGLVLAQWVAPSGFRLAAGDLGIDAVDLSPDRWILAFTAALSLVTGLIVGAGSVLRASSANPQEALRNVRVQGSPRLTKMLLSSQIALTMTLVGSAALFLQTLTNFRNLDAGFRTDQLLTVTMDAGLAALERPRAAVYLTRAAEALAALPGVRAVTYSNAPMGTGVPTNLVLDVPGFTGSDPQTASTGIISAGPGFVRTLGMSLVAGRDLDGSDRSGSEAVAIVNESFATHFFGTSDVVGRTFAFRGPGNTPISIVGVVKDARDRGVKRSIQPVIYTPYGQGQARAATFTLRTDADGLANIVRRTLDRLDPAVGVARIRTVDAQFDDTLRRERLLATLGAVFAGLALLLLAIGLYGMLNSMVVRRTTEIGVRMALGAPSGAIAWMIARETLAMLAVGIAAGLAGQFAAGRIIGSELFGVTAADPLAAVAAVLVLLAVAALAVWLPARRATRIEPTEALRHDYV